MEGMGSGAGGLTASDVALLNDRTSGDLWGGNSFLWIFALLILAGGGFNGLGGANGAATTNEVQRGFDAQNSVANQREILSAVNAGTTQAVAATNQARYDNINVMKDIQGEIDREIGEIQQNQAIALANQNQCCSNTLRAIDGLKYEGAMNTASINENTTTQIQKVLDRISENKIEALQQKINQLELNNAVAGVVRYPNQSTFNAGYPPFFNGPFGS